MEIALCLFCDIPGHVKRSLPVKLDGGIDEWFDEQLCKYRVVGAWLLHFNLGLKLPSEILKEPWIQYKADADVIQRSLELCRSVHPFSAWCQHIAPSNEGWLRVWCRIMMSDFQAAIADSGVGFALALPGYPPGINQGKSEIYSQAIAVRSKLESRGRPLKKGARPYPIEATLFNSFVLEANRIARRNKQIAQAFSTFLAALEASDSLAERCGDFQAAYINDATRKLVVGGKGFSVKQKARKRR
jgi:hypothetical protein